MRWILTGCLLLIISGSGLYLVKRSIDARHDELARLQRQITNEKNNAAILNAEWSYLTRPDRLLQLSNDLLSMQPMDVERVLPLEAIPVRSSHQERHTR